VPSEAIMLFAAFAVSKGELTLAGIVIAGVLGNLVGSLIGYFGRLDLLERNRPFHVSPARLRQTEGCARPGRPERRRQLRELAPNLGYLDYAVAAAIVIGIGWWLVKRRGDSDAAPA
jgi:hypothetical protein